MKYILIIIALLLAGSVVAGDTMQFRDYKPPKSWAYKPKTNITAYELALLMPVLMAYQRLNTNVETLVEALPEGAKRHLEEVK
jgi:hypothetical protein